MKKRFVRAPSGAIFAIRDGCCVLVVDEYKKPVVELVAAEDRRALKEFIATC